MRIQVSIQKCLVFTFTIVLITLGVLGNLSYGASSRPQIYWTDAGTGKIQRANLDGTGIQDIVAEGLDSPEGIAIDVTGGKIYWTDGNNIQQANLNGSNIQNIIAAGFLDTPYGIALEVAGGKIYWTNWFASKIQRANLDGSNVQDLITKGLEFPESIALDAANGKIYWTSWLTEKIYRANLDGSNIQNIVTLESLELPQGIALDVARGKIYWTSAGLFTSSKIQRANLDGSNIQDIITEGLDTPSGIVLDMPGGKMYWTDEGTGKIQRANLNGSNVQDIVTGLREPNSIALGISPQHTPEKQDRETEDAAFVSAIPASGALLSTNASITVTFSSDPGDVTASTGTVSGSGKTRTITGPFTPGALRLTILWTNSDGSLTLFYNFAAPDIMSPTVTGGTVKDGDKDVDPEVINTDGKIEITFSEDISGNIALQTEWGDDVGWLGKVEGNKATLELVKGKDIRYETTYVIRGKISDAAGNETEVSITFVTPLLETAVNVDGLVAYWAFNEASGATATDASGNGHDGTLLGAPKRTAGYFGGALAFDGADDKVVVPYHRALNPETFSICFWVNVAPGSTWYRTPVSCRDVENDLTSGYNFYVIPDNRWQFWIGTGNPEWHAVTGPWRAVTGPEVRFGEWEHITGVYADGSWKFYVNGELSGQAYEPTLRLNVNTRQELLIGAGANEEATHNFYFEGMIDEVRVYNRALDVAEVALVMETEVAGLPVGPKKIVEDVNGDGVVDLQDLGFIFQRLGQTGKNPADVNKDGVVDADDIVLVGAALDKAAAAPAVRSQIPKGFTAARLNQWLTEAKLKGRQTSRYQRGILMLAYLLAALTPEETALLANYPNPFNPETWIPYQLSTSAEVRLTIYDIQGRVVRTLSLGHQAAGIYQTRSRAAHWDGRNALGEPVASGVYFYTLTAGDFTVTRKMLIRK